LPEDLKKFMKEKGVNFIPITKEEMINIMKKARERYIKKYGRSR